MKPAVAAVASAAEIVGRAAAREFPFTDREFEKIAKRLYDEAGIDMPRSKEPLVYSRLAKRIRRLGLSSFADYIKLLDDAAGDELEHLLVALTTNVTRFFREPHHFEDLKTRVMPELSERAKRRGRVRLWSAGCSSGQEPYTIALTVLDAFPDAGAYDLKILATDINTQVLAEGKLGLYPAAALVGAPQALRERYFIDNGDETVQAGDEVRKLIAFRRLNLMESWPMKGVFDVIFCRNVMIYFDEPTQAGIWKRFAEKLAPGGRLYIGHSERIGGEAARMLSNEGVTSYRRLGG